MKKFIFSALLLGTVATVSAQKNTLLVGGNVSYEKNDSDNTRSYELNPKVGYQFSDHWTIGAETSMGKVEYKDNDDEETTFSTGGFLRYTLPLGNGKFAFFTELGGGYLREESKDGLTNTDATADGWYTTLTPSLFINFKNGFGLNFNIGGAGYNSIEGKDGYEYDKDNVFVDFGKSVGFGISKNFGLK